MRVAEGNNTGKLTDESLGTISQHDSPELNTQLEDEDSIDV
jgi:hypothetical protein